MNYFIKTLPLSFALIVSTLTLSACSRWQASPPPAPTTQPPVISAAAPLPSANDAREGTIRFLEERVKDDPQDFIALNKLSGYYQERARESGDVKYWELSEKAAQASLKVFPAPGNPGALASLAQTIHNLHDFSGARDLAQQLIVIAPRKSYSYRILGDALLELGDYDKAEEAFRQMQKLEEPFPSAASEIRFGRLDLLHGRTKSAQSRYSQALRLSLEQVPQQVEVIAWCHWQLGEVAFGSGDYAAAEQHYRASLTTFTNYHRAQASLGRLLGARGDLAAAIEQYEKVVQRLPDPVFVAALGDLYKLAGKEKDAAAQYALVEHIARLSELNGNLYNRQLASFYADHDVKAAESYALAKKEYDKRRDIYGADALAWAALKAGKIPEAQAASREALRFGTQDAKFFYHAGMIAHAAGDQSAARDNLQHALKLNPKFDPLQATLAEKTLAEL